MNHITNKRLNNGQSVRYSHNKIIPEKPETWGPHIWISMHAIAAGYPLDPTEIDKDLYKLHFENMPNVLPCINCRNHFHEIIQKYPITDEMLTSRKSLSIWVTEVHNMVSRELAKPAQQCNWTYEMLASVVDQNSGITSSDSLTSVTNSNTADALVYSIAPVEPISVLDKKIMNQSSQMKQMMNIQKANLQRTKFIQKQSNRNYGYVGLPNNAGTRHELHRNRVQQRRVLRAPPRALSGYVPQPNIGSGSASAKPKRKGCGCSGKKR